jgi:hypothetical protein
MSNCRQRWRQSGKRLSDSLTGRCAEAGEACSIIIHNVLSAIIPHRMERCAMSTDLRLASGSASQRYEALLRISEGLSACCEPEELSRVLADQLDSVINFDHLDVLVLRENSDEIEWHAWGKGSVPFPDAPIEELPTWHVYNSQEPLHIADWNKDEIAATSSLLFARISERVTSGRGGDKMKCENYESTIVEYRPVIAPSDSSHVPSTEVVWICRMRKTNACLRLCWTPGTATTPS